jgi:hypothetical protein
MKKKQMEKAKAKVNITPNELKNKSFRLEKKDNHLLEMKKKRKDRYV